MAAAHGEMQKMRGSDREKRKGLPLVRGEKPAFERMRMPADRLSDYLPAGRGLRRDTVFMGKFLKRCAALWESTGSRTGARPFFYAIWTHHKRFQIMSSLGLDIFRIRVTFR